MGTSDKVWIPITAALIAAFISLVNVLIAKDQKITEFRQAWINSVREEVSKFISLALAVSSLRHIVDGRNVDQSSRDQALTSAESIIKNERARCSECRTRIILFLNPDDDQVIIQKVESIYESSALASEIDHLDIQGRCEALVSDMQILLKDEWKRVKRGEGLYRAVKLTIVIAVVVLLVFAAVTTKPYWE